MLSSDALAVTARTEPRLLLRPFPPAAISCLQLLKMTWKPLGELSMKL